MNDSQLPYRYWFIAIHLFTSMINSFSAPELQQQLGHNSLFSQPPCEVDSLFILNYLLNKNTRNYIKKEKETNLIVVSFSSKYINDN